MKQIRYFFLDKKINYKIVIFFSLILGAFYWWQVRPVYIKSSCTHIAVLNAKAESFTPSLYDSYVSLTQSPSYNGFNDFLEKEYKNNKDFLKQTYNSEDYNFDYSRCLHAHGL